MKGSQLSPVQQEAIRHPARRLHVVASAGAGKTEVLARRSVWLMTEHGVPPESLIAFTFTEKAAGELRQRIEERAAEADPGFAELPPVSRGMFVGTTHAWALEALKAMGAPYELVDVLDEAAEWSLLQRVARRLGVLELFAAAEDRDEVQVAVSPAVERFLRSAEVVHNERIPIGLLAGQAPEFAAVLQRYERLLLEMRVLPFRMLLGHAADALAPGGPLRRRLEGRVRHVLVDEAQDFNRAQEEILRHLMDLGAAVTVVGDDDQAIYQWRGGDVRIFTDFDGRHPEVERIQLTTNYRSRPEIVRTAAGVAGRLRERLPKELRTHREPLPPGSVEFFVAETPSDEAERMAGRIDRLLAEGHRPAEVAVLLRSVRTAAGPFVNALRRRGIPVTVVGQTSLLSRPEMALVARIFVFWTTPGLEPASWRPDPHSAPETVTPEELAGEVAGVTGMAPEQATALVTRLAGLGDQVRTRGVGDLIALYHQLLALLDLPRAGRAHEELGLGRMSTLLTSFEHSLRRAAPAWLYETVEAQEAEEDRLLQAEAGEGGDNGGEGGEDGREGKAVRLGLPPGEVFLARLRAFLEAFVGRAAEETPDTLPTAAEAVQVMTVHQAKGLEFPVVFVPSLVERRFPSARMGERQVWYVPETLFDRARYEGREDDEARLFFVALSRARELLVLSTFTRYEKGGRTKPSRFLLYLAEALSAAQQLHSVHPAAVAVHGDRQLLVLDFSSLLLYEGCAYRYWLSRVCGFQPVLARELGFGRLLHHAVAELGRRTLAGAAPRAADVPSIVARSFYLPFAGSIPRARLQQAAVRRLTHYMERHGQELRRVLQPEMRFEVPLSGARVRGRVDLLLRRDGEGAGREARREERDGERGERGGEPLQVELVDFKTSENRPPSEAHQNQLRLYGLACRRLGYDPVGLFIHDLDVDQGGRLRVEEDDGSRRAFEALLEEWVDGIRSARFTPNPGPTTCGSCDFRTFCAHSVMRGRVA
ncbi:ATP-dependent helicase [Limnochorda pilosa]|uniref:DNA 3'-5' helicase n=1 Tax=Limnochorda pilosa TaxID=1555112 RepID=A0A0K2SLR8_LIMPI|nr:ATP-dependent DNA helicase [Limnochorda pilosa]BAS28063.1 DNA helicase [Limnochorda pilosa]